MRKFFLISLRILTRHNWTDFGERMIDDDVYEDDDDGDNDDGEDGVLGLTWFWLPVRWLSSLIFQ